MFAQLERSLERLSCSASARRRAVWVGVGLTLCVAHTLPLVADEVYYLWWASVPDLGYLDHPPAVMLWAWLSDHVLWGPRAMNLLTLIGSGWLLTRAAQRLTLKRAELLPLTALFTPFGVALGVVLTPDAPLVLGWSLALWGWAAQAPVRAGLGTALMLWSKPSALLPLGLLSLAWLIYPLNRRDGRALGSVSRLWIVALALYLPHVWWSNEHDWLPWSFQASRAWGRFGLLEWLGAQLWLVSPLWGWWGVSSARRVLWERSGHAPRDNACRSLAVMGLGQLLFWGLISLGMRVEGNWSALAWPPLLMLALHKLGEAEEQGSEQETERPFARGVLWGALCVAPLYLAPLLLRLAPLHVGPPRAPRALLSQTDACLAQHHDLLPHVPMTHLSAGRYQEMALLWWAMRSRPELERGRLSYLNAAGRRTSEFERRADHQAPQCDYLYLGPNSWLSGRCSGETLELNGPACLLTDALTPTLCRCPPLEHEVEHEVEHEAVERPPVKGRVRGKGLEPSRP